MTQAKKTNDRLSDGRIVRPLKGTFKQADMFSLKGKIPSYESIMNVKDLDDALNVSGAWKVIDVKGCWRTNSYGVYARGFERELDKPVGAMVVWIEGDVPYTFEVPDVKHPHDKNKCLREAAGMLDFALDKLQYDENKRIVSVTSDFNPESDVIIRDIMRPRGWALVDADGYPLRTKSSDKDISEARSFNINHYNDFVDEATGWHGSVIRGVARCDYGGGDGFRRIVYALYGWQFGSGVAVVGREASNSKLTILRQGNEELVVRGTPEQIEAAARLLEQLKQ